MPDTTAPGWGTPDAVLAATEHMPGRQAIADRLAGSIPWLGHDAAVTVAGMTLLALAEHGLTVVPAMLREHGGDLNDLIQQEREIHERTIRRAEQAEAAIARVRDLHYEYKIYADCGHDAHHDDDARVVETDDGRYVCADGYQYSVCHECCTASGEPTEHCAETHDHTDGWQCATILALTEAGAVSEPTEEVNRER
ncbi:MAG: hypothetical protein IRZ07_28315 [Microbispora sp.]|nr:hypothetical protein [Microbispora sp.]